MMKKLSAMLLVAILSCCCILDAGVLRTEATKMTDKQIKRFAAASLLVGDVDGDGAINSLDAADILTEAALIGTGESGSFTSEQVQGADVNVDNFIDAIDASLILSYASYVGSGGTLDFADYIEEMASSSIVSLTAEEKKLLAALVTLEVGSESYECKLAVTSLIINRMLTSDSTLEEVIYAPNQFSVASKVASTTPSDSCVNAVNEVLATGTTLPIYVTFFRAGTYHSWGDQVPYCCIDNTYFSYSQALKNQYT